MSQIRIRLKSARGSNPVYSDESMNQPKYSFHRKNNPSEAQLLDKEDIQFDHAPLKSKTLMNAVRRKATILPMYVPSSETRTPEGFSLQKFIEENQKKMEEKQLKIEGKKSILFFRNQR